MTIIELESLFEKEETLINVLEYCRPYMEKQQKLINLMGEGKVLSKIQDEEMIKELVSLEDFFGKLFLIAEEQEEYHLNLEVERFRQQFEANAPVDEKGKKERYTDSMGTKAGKMISRQWSRVRSILQGFYNGTTKNVSVLQSIMKNKTQ